jgi:DNA-binding MarR family transcriptional regulator
MISNQPQAQDRQPTTWVFLTNHAHVLVCIARDPQIRARDIADHVGITERAAQRILADLIADRYVARRKSGRRNHYTINPRGNLRHPILRNLAIGDLLEVLDSANPPPI